MSEGKENSIFIGARTLKEEEVKIIVPTYDAIISRVEDIRREASNKSNDKDNENIKKYNNTITLFGNRGTGKTSTMYTVRNELKKNINNIFLEIIEPDSIGQEGKIMGCILGLFKDEIDKLQNDIKQKGPQNASDKIKKDFFEDCRFKENNPIKKAYNDVLEYYCYTEKDYKKLLTCNYNDMNSYIKKSSHVFNADIEFGKKFKDFINKFIEYKKKHNCNEKNINNNESNEPLIFIFIDDVDLNTNKCQEIIEAILRYGSHANIICFITGDYDTFAYGFTISLLKHENLKEANLGPNIKINKKTILESKQELAHEYMKKVFPPAYRHYVNTWELSLIPEYSFTIGESEKKVDLFKLLSRISEKRGIENIFGYCSADESKIVYYLPAYNMFDKTSRGLINVYYSLLNINDNLNKYKEQEYFVNIKSLIENIIDASNILVKYSDEIKKKYILWGTNSEQSKIDFEQLENLFKDEYEFGYVHENICQDRNSIEIVYSLFYICYYISILIPEIQYSKEKRKEVFKRAMYQLVSNPKLNGHNISIECNNYIYRYFLDNVNNYIEYDDNYYYRYNIYFRRFICEILAESQLSFSQKFYNEIVNCNLLRYEVFDTNYEISEEKYNALYITFYKSLYNDINKDTKILMEFYDNQSLKKYMNFLEMKSNQDKEELYIEVIFKELFDGFNEMVNEQIMNKLKEDKDKNVIKTIKEDFLSLVKLELKNACSNISTTSNNFNECITNLIEQYKDVKSYYKNAIIRMNRRDITKVNINKKIRDEKQYLNLAEAIYKVHENEINVDSNKENFYEDTKIFDVITKLMINTYGYDIANIFVNCIGKIEQFSSKIMTSRNEMRLEIDLSNDEIEVKIEEFFNSVSGGTQTKANRAKICVRNLIEDGKRIKSERLLDIYGYSQLMKILNDLYFSNSYYSKKEAKKLIDALNNNVKIKLNGKPFCDKNEVYIMQSYSLFIQRAKLKSIDFSELEKAKLYLKKVLPKAKEEQEANERKYLDKIGIADDYEV